jgi:hypothetical protein
VALEGVPPRQPLNVFCPFMAAPLGVEVLGVFAVWPGVAGSVWFGVVA